VPGAQVRLVRAEQPQPRAPAFRAFTLRQFKSLDPAGKGLPQEAAARLRGRALGDLFAVADRDGGGGVTEKEPLAFPDLLEGAPDCVVTLGCSDGGHGLFELLDADGDGRLDLHELHTAWSRLAPLAGADGCVTKEGLPQQLQVMVQQGATDTVFLQRQPLRPTGAATAAPPRGPLSFRN